MHRRPVLTSNIDPTEPPPFCQLRQERFEKLIESLVCREPDVQRSDLYCTNHQRQFGIDVFGETKHGLIVASCKCQQRVRRGELGEWSNEFLCHYDDHWKHKNVLRFILAVAAPVQSSERLREIDEQRARFASLNIHYTVWAPRQLQAKLYDKPDIANRYCGSTWARMLCGPSPRQTTWRRRTPELFSIIKSNWPLQNESHVREQDQFHELAYFATQLHNAHTRGSQTGVLLADDNSYDFFVEKCQEHLARRDEISGVEMNLELSSGMYVTTRYCRGLSVNCVDELNELADRLLMQAIEIHAGMNKKMTTNRVLIQLFASCRLQRIASQARRQFKTRMSFIGELDQLITSLTRSAFDSHTGDIHKIVSDAMLYLNDTKSDGPERALRLLGDKIKWVEEEVNIAKSNRANTIFNSWAKYPWKQADWNLHIPVARMYGLYAGLILGDCILDGSKPRNRFSQKNETRVTELIERGRHNFARGRGVHLHAYGNFLADTSLLHFAKGHTAPALLQLSEAAEFFRDTNDVFREKRIRDIIARGGILSKEDIDIILAG